VRFKNLLAGRRRRCRALLVKHRLDGLLVTDPLDVSYLSGFSGDDSVLLVAGASAVLVTDSRYVVQAKRQCQGTRVHCRSGPMAATIAELLAKRFRRPGRKFTWTIGVEADAITVAAYRAYRRALPGKVRVVTGLVRSLRVRKDGYEVGRICRAVRVAEEAMGRLLRWLRVGRSELELAAKLDYEMAALGSTDRAFETIAAVGAHAAEPHARPGKRRLGKGQVILFDWGATVGGYRSDLTRCYATGRIRPAFAEAYRRVLAAQGAAISAVRPGVTVGEVDEAARKELAGVAGAYGHGIGHGLGLAVHEPPLGERGGATVLEEGMVMTIEPAVYRPGRFGIRIEDDVLVTSTGSRVLSRLPKCLEAIRI